MIGYSSANVKFCKSYMKMTCASLAKKRATNGIGFYVEKTIVIEIASVQDISVFFVTVLMYLWGNHLYNVHH